MCVRLLDVTFAPELVRFGLLVAPRHVGLLVLPIPRFDEDDVVLSNPDTFLHSSGDASGPLDAVGTADANTIGPEHVGHDGEHFVVVRHSKVSAALVLVVAHARAFDGVMFKPADVCLTFPVAPSDAFRGVPTRTGGMLDKLGTKGIVGIVCLLAGIGIVAVQAPIVAAGIALVVAGMGLVASGLAEGVMKMFGMA